MNSSPPGSSVQGFLQARILEWVAMLCCRGLPDPEIELVLLLTVALVVGFFTTSASWETLLLLESESHSVMSDSLQPHGV